MATILIVDDDPVILKQLEKRLSTWGHAVIKAKDGREAVKLANQHIPQLIIMDVLMPGLDGTEAGQLLKENLQTKHIPLIYLTALAEQYGAASGTPFSKILAKPFNPTELAREIEHSLSLRIS